MSAPTLPSLLEAHQSQLVGYCVPRAGWLLRYEGADDIAQSICVRALERGGDFEYRSDEEFRAWLYTMARQYLSDRRAYWSALKRRSAALLRLTEAVSTGAEGAPVPASTATGPATVAQRREQLTLIVQVLGSLRDRDAQLVRWASEGVPLREQAIQLDVAYDAVKKASQRALSRFQSAYRYATGA